MNQASLPPDPSPPDSGFLAGATAGVLGLLAVLAVAAVSLWPAITRALWTDDLYSLTTAEESLPQIIRLCASAQANYYDHPPLYFLLLHQVLYFGDSPLLLRAFSLVCTVLATVLLGIETRRHFGFWTAAGLVLLLAAHPTLAFQATHVRMYALYFLECAVIGILTLRLLSSQSMEPRHRSILVLALSAAVAAALYTVYFSVLLILLVAALGAAAAAFPRLLLQESRRSGLLILTGIGIGLLLYLPWLPVFLKVMAGAGGHLPTPIPPLEKFLRLLHQIGATLPALIVAAAGFVGLFLGTPAQKRLALVSLLAIIAPVAALAAFTPAERQVDVRYVLHAVPLLLVVTTAGLCLLGRRLPLRPPMRLALGAAIILAVSAGFLVRAWQTVFKPVPDWWAVAAVLEQHAHPHEIILTGGFLSGEAVVYHLKNPTRFSFVHYVTRLNEFQRWTRDPRVIWYVNAAPIPPEYAALRDAAFPYRRTYPGNGGNTIEVAAKKPF